MTDMTLEQMAAKIRSHADFVGSIGGSGELMDSVELSDIADAIDAHLAKAAQGEVVETDQSIQADCYEMIADKYEAVGMSPASIVETSKYLADAWSAFQDLPDDTIDRLLVGKATDGDQSLVYGAISHIRDLQNESVFTATPADYERAVTEQAMLTECVSVTGRDPSDVILDVIQWHVSNAAQPVEALEFLAVAYEKSGNSLIVKALRANGPSKNAYDYEIAIKAISAALAHPRPTGSGCPCEPSGSDGLRCPDESGKLLCDPASDRTGEQAGEVIDWTDDDVETLRCLRDAVGKYANLKKLWVPTIEKMLARARHVENATAMPYAQPRPVGVRHEAFFAVLRERVEHFERIGKVGGKYIDGRRHEARLILDCCNEALLAAAPDGEVG